MYVHGKGLISTTNGKMMLKMMHTCIAQPYCGEYYLAIPLLSFCTISQHVCVYCSLNIVYVVPQWAIIRHVCGR